MLFRIGYGAGILHVEKTDDSRDGYVIVLSECCTVCLLLP